MKTMKTFSRRIAALLLVVIVGITALAPAASASEAIFCIFFTKGQVAS